MANRLGRAALAGLLIATFIVTTATACGPFFPEVTLVESEHPDSPGDFAAGRLGIIQPTYSISYLVAAYRYLSNRPFDASEQKQLVALWDESLNPPSDPGPSTAYATTGGYESYRNCLEDAYKTAEQTRLERLQQFGAGSIALMSWADAQGAVFSNCNSVNPSNPFLPEIADPSLPQIVRKDRDYQLAAAYFYAGDWNEARKRFLSISQDSSSPWKAIAGLVVARCDIRAASLGIDDPVEQRKDYASADAQLKKIIADPAFSSVKASAERLLGLVEYRLDPTAYFVGLSKAIELGLSPETLKASLGDYTKLFRTTSPQAVEAARKQSAMTDWIYSLARDLDTGQSRVAHWQQEKSIPWLVASLAYAKPDTSQVAALLDSAAGVPETSPAYLTVAFHRARILAAQGKDAQARMVADDALRLSADQMPASARNLFSAERMHLATDLSDFLKYAPRTVTGSENYHPNTNFIFDSDAAQILTQKLPTEVLLRAAAAASLDNNLRRQIAEAAWVRAALLDQYIRARQIVPVLSSLAPDLTTGLNDYAKAASPPERGFTAAFVILHRPELHPYVYAEGGRQADDGTIDPYRDNWWCALGGSFAAPFAGGANRSQNFYEMYARLAGPLGTLYPGGAITAPEFVTARERQTAEKEWTSVAQSGAAPNWLGKVVLVWAKSHPTDVRVPEALHLVVVATRVGCTDADSGNYSRQAFTLLYNRYPTNEWTAKTPYWFN